MRAPKTVLIATCAAALLAAGVASAATGSYNDGPLKATFSASTTRPNCKQMWPVTVTARLHGRYTHAVARYQFLSNGSVVDHINPFADTSRNRADRPWHFYGRFTDNTFGPFGALAVGHRLNVRAVVTAGRYTAYPSLWVTVVKTRGCKAIH
ncbi:MAG: hypothetical protein ACRDL5_02035 [Solirubrobacteraceae bacterium]